MWRSRSNAVPRVALVVMLVAASLIALSGRDDRARAQDATGTGVGIVAAAVSPDDSAFFLGVTLDTESSQWNLTEELLARAGFVEDLSDVVVGINPNAETGSIDVPVDDQAFLGGEVAVVLADADSLEADIEALSGLLGGFMLPGGEFAAF